ASPLPGSCIPIGVRSARRRKTPNHRGHEDHREDHETTKDTKVHEGKSRKRPSWTFVSFVVNGVALSARNNRACFLLKWNGCAAKSFVSVTIFSANCPARSARSRHPRQCPAPAYRCQTRLPVHPRSHRLRAALHGQ